MVHYHRVGPGGLNRCINPPASGCDDEPRPGRQVTITQLADIYGVSVNTAHNWFSRRATTGFPEPVAEKPRGGAGAPGWLFDLDQVNRWRLEWKRGRRDRA